MKRMMASENLFSIVGSDTSHKYSSRQGLFLIKDLAELAGGTYALITNDDTVTIRLCFNKAGDGA